MMGKRLAFVLALALVAGSDKAQENVLDRGAAALAPFKRELQEALRQGLAQGPSEAIAACRLEAPALAEAHSKEGIRLGRTSHRLRNPENAAPAWVRPILEAYLASPRERAPRAVTLSGGRSGYVEPILMQPLCLSCHGQSLAFELATKIKELYPKDQAIGFRPDELRGVLWVELPAPK